jgi:RNase P subunit RPR2
MNESDRLGRCPNCTTAIPKTRMLIRYQGGDGTRIFAECPECRDVVHPRR